MKSWTLREDILASESPFAAMQESKSWEEVMLGTNTVSKNPFPLFHVTGNKRVRDWWWPRMWFHPHGEELLKATKKKGVPPEKLEDQEFAVVDEVGWVAAKPVQARTRIDNVGKGGAWVAASGEWVPWHGMCGVHEKVLFLEEEVGVEGVD